jgi:hypothetical protein
LYGKGKLSVVRLCRTIFQSGSTILHHHQQ